MFFDNASTTKIDSRIIENISELNEVFFYNPGGLYSKGRKVKELINDCRHKIMDKLNASDGNIVFTGSATEANNLALRGTIKKNMKALVSVGEHPSVYNTAIELRQQGYKVEFLCLDSDGKVDLEDFRFKMTDEVDFVSIMHVSNETGAINDIAELVSIARDINPNVIFHCDGVQAVGKIKVDIDELDVDMYTMSAHKIYGMKGVGALYVRDIKKLKTIMFGGGQEFGLRSGTENLIGIKSLSDAVDFAVSELDDNFKNACNCKLKFLEVLQSSDLDYVLNSRNGNSPYIVSVSFPGCRAETLLNMLDDEEVYVGNGSACSSKNSGNRVLENMGLNKSVIEGNLRISFSKDTSVEDVEKMTILLCDVVKKYRENVKK